jgi:hypothetical protein
MIAAQKVIVALWDEIERREKLRTENRYWKDCEKTIEVLHERMAERLAAVERERVDAAAENVPPRCRAFSDARLVLKKKCLGRVTSSPRLSAEKLEGENRGPSRRDTQQTLPRQTQNSPARSDLPTD